MSEQKSFFSTLPGVLTGLAGLVTAIAGLVYALNETGFIGSHGQEDIKAASVESQTSISSEPKKPTPETPEPKADIPKPQIAVAPDKPELAVPKAPQEQTTDGWAIIGFYEQGKFSDLKLMVHGDSPAIGRSYDIVDDFRLVQKKLEQSKGKAVITLGKVHRGDSVEVLDIEIDPGTRKVPVWAKLRAVLHNR